VSRSLAPVLCLTLTLVAACAPGGRTTDADEGARRREVPVTVVRTVTDDVVFSSPKVGAVKVNRQVSINFTTPGRLEHFMAEEDQYVRENEPIARLDETELKAAVETARIQLADLEKRKEKLEGFLQKGVVTEAEYDQVKTQYLTTKEQLTVARDRLEKAVVKAPFAGIVFKKLAEQGSFVPPGAPIAVLVDIDHIRVELDFSDREISKVAVGSAIEVKADAYPDKTFRGTIDRVVPSVDPRSRMTRVELLIPNPGRLLRPGMLVRTDVVVGSYRQVISLPVDCLVYQGKRTFVYVVDGSSNTARRRDVTVETLYRDRAVVTSGLSAGESVVESGQSYLADGTSVRILE